MKNQSVIVLGLLLMTSFLYPLEAAGMSSVTTFNPVAPPNLVQYHSNATAGEDTCQNAGVCGMVSGSSENVIFLADFAYNCNTNEFAVVEVGGKNEIFTMSDDCVETGYGYHDPAISQSGRGLAYHQQLDVYFTSSWNWEKIYTLDPSFAVIDSSIDENPGAGNAVDEEHNFLYESVNSSPDRLVQFKINPDLTVSPTGNVWTIPWACGSDGYDAASLDYDDETGYLFIINMYANALEWFSIQDSVMVPEGHCYLEGIARAWGMGSDDEVVKVADVAGQAPPFPVWDVLAPIQGKCNGQPQSWSVRYLGFSNEGVNKCGFALGARVSNNTGSTETKVIYVTTNPPSGKLLLDTIDFPAGTSLWYGCIPLETLTIPSGTYDLLLVVADNLSAEPDAESGFTATLYKPGLQ